VGIPDGFQSAGYAKTVKEFRNSFIEICADFVVRDARNGGIRGYSIVEDCECVTVALSRRWGGELENCRCRQGDSEQKKR